MRDIQIKEYCDYCWAESERRTLATSSWHVALGDAKQKRVPNLRELSTCDKHVKAVLALHALVLERLAPAEAEPASPVNGTPKRAVNGTTDTLARPCPICGVKLRNLGPHVWNVHVGGTPPRPTSCPDCDWQPGPGIGPGKEAVSVGRHRATMHGYDPLAEGLAEYQRLEGRRDQLPL